MRLRLSRDPFVWLLLLLGTILLLTNLGSGRLWQDEAETAILGRNILRYGYPRAFDGVNLLNPGLPLQEGFAWTYHSWLPMYLVAGSFLLFGINTVAARLPFAGLGIGCLLLAYRVFKEFTQDRWMARLGALTLLTNVPFLLHMRQCRYYAPSVLLSLWASLAYWRFLRNRRLSGIELFFALTLLFHADHGVFLPVALGLGLHFALSRPSPQEWHRALALAVVLLASTVPWIIYLQAGQHHRAFSWVEVRHHLEFYFRQINRYLMPLGFWLLACILWRPPLRSLIGAPGTPVRRAWGLVGSLLSVGMLFLILIPEQRHFRYLMFLVPWFFLVQATLLAQLFRSRGWIGLILTVVLLSTDLIQYSGTSLLAAQIPSVRSKLSSPNVKVRSLPLEFLGELTHSYRGPMDGIVDLLKAQGRPGQVVKIPYEEHPLIFYTDLRIEPFLKPEDFRRETFPDWIVLRRDWVSPDFFQSSYYREILSRYKQVLLDAPDIPWQNRPDPGYHRFRTDAQAPPVIVFQKQQ